MIVDMWDRIVQASIGGFAGVFTACLIWTGYLVLKDIRKAWKMDHKHDRKWSREEYFQHIKEAHPDIWKEHLEGEEEE